MGLDMYLFAEQSFYGFEYGRPGEQERFAELVELVGHVPSHQMPKVEVATCVAYWRKANHIHKWFVDNVQDGKDECQRSYVSPEELAELVQTCRTAMTLYDAGDLRAAGELLPPQAGFFFGGTEVDQSWRDGLAATVSQLEPLLTKHHEPGEPPWDPDNVTFFYEASW